MRLALRDGTYLDAHQLGADRYSYHWQRPGETVRRNNAPHFNHIDTALHHLHIGQEVRASPVRGVSEQDVRQVLRFIQSQIEGD
ncbi:MAG: DUF6516 family protein [Firmicutes bacterium]|nr:DUF6516 family protein [Bacillota bacterium]